MTDEVKRTFDLTDADYERAIGILVLHQKASTSFLQRTMRLGYNAAASLMERAEGDGFVSRAANTGKRDVLISLQEIARLRAELANAGAVMVEACAQVARDHTPEKHSGATLASHVTGRAIENAIRTISTLSPIAAAARVLLADDVAISRMAEAIHDGPLGANGHWFSAATKKGGWCVDVARAALRALAEQEKADE